MTLASLQQQHVTPQHTQAAQQLLPAPTTAQGVDALLPGATSLQYLQVQPETASLTAFGQSRFQSPSPQYRARGRGFGHQARGSFSQTRRPFCKTCYDSNKGKDTYLSHVTANQNCPSRPQFSSIETYPLKVIETGDHLTPS